MCARVYVCVANNRHTMNEHRRERRTAVCSGDQCASLDNEGKRAGQEALGYFFNVLITKPKAERRMNETARHNSRQQQQPQKHHRMNSTIHSNNKTAAVMRDVLERRGRDGGGGEMVLSGVREMGSTNNYIRTWRTATTTTALRVTPTTC